MVPTLESWAAPNFANQRRRTADKRDVGTKKGEIAGKGNDARNTVGQAPHVAALASLDKNKDPGATIETLSTCQPGSAHVAGTAMNALEYHSPAAGAAVVRMSLADARTVFIFPTMTSTVNPDFAKPVNAVCNSNRGSSVLFGSGAAHCAAR